MTNLVKIDIGSVVTNAFLTTYAQKKLATYTRSVIPQKILSLAQAIFSNDAILRAPRSCIAVAMLDILQDTTSDPLDRWLVQYGTFSYNLLNNNYISENAAMKILITKELGLITDVEKIIISASIATSVIGSVLNDSRHNNNIIFTPAAILLLQELEADNVQGMYKLLKTGFIDTAAVSFFPLMNYLPSYFNGTMPEVFEIHALVIFKNMMNNITPAEQVTAQTEFESWIINNVISDDFGTLAKAVSITLQNFYDSLVAEALQP